MCFDRCELIAHCGFDLHFSDAYWPSVCLLWKNIYSCLLPIFNFFLDVELYKLFMYFDINPLLIVPFVIVFSHSVSCLFISLMVSFAIQNF